MTRLSSLVTSAALGAALLLSLAACGSSGTNAESPPSPPTQSAPASPTGGTPADPAASGSPTAAAPGSAAPSTEPYRKLRGAFKDIPVVAEVYPIQRGPKTATANVRFIAVKSSDTFRIGTLNDSNPELGDSNNTAPDGLRLIDTTAGKAYLPATIGDQECLCSPRINTVLDNYTDVTVSVTFAAPPAELTAIDLVIPRFGTVRDVPLR